MSRAHTNDEWFESGRDNHTAEPAGGSSGPRLREFRRNAVGTGGHSAGATTGAGGVASSAGAGASPAGTTASGGLPATGGVSSNGGISNTGGVLATGGTATTGGSPVSGGVSGWQRGGVRWRYVQIRWRGFHHGRRWRKPLPVSVVPRRQADPRARAGRAPVAPRPAASLARWWAAARLAAPVVLRLAAARPAASAVPIRRPVRPAAPPTPIPFAILASPLRIA